MHIASQFRLLICLILMFMTTGVTSSVSAQQARGSSPLLSSGTLEEQRRAGPISNSESLRRLPYIGLGVGRSSLEPDTASATGITVSESEQTGVQLTLGMDVNKWFSVEAHAADLGSAELSDDTSIGYREYGLSALLYVGQNRSRFNRRGWTLYGRTGIGSLSNSASEGVRLQTNEGMHWILGAGAEYATRSGVALRAEGIAFDQDISYLQLGLLYRFGGWPGLSNDRRGFDKSLEAQREKMRKMSGRATRTPTPDDDDGDGIQHSDDKCPDTPQRIAVGESGCAALNGVLDGLTFESGSAQLTDSARQVLDSVVDSLRQNPDSRARVSAHTDNAGDADANMELSRQRAFAVARYLVQQGRIPKARLEARAYGETRPIDTNSTVAGRENNRRVEIVLIQE